jgi:hypothetical protein
MINYKMISTFFLANEIEKVDWSVENLKRLKVVVNFKCSTRN